MKLSKKRIHRPGLEFIRNVCKHISYDVDIKVTPKLEDQLIAFVEMQLIQRNIIFRRLK